MKVSVTPKVPPKPQMNIRCSVCGAAPCLGKAAHPALKQLCDNLGGWWDEDQLKSYNPQRQTDMFLRHLGTTSHIEYVYISSPVIDGEIKCQEKQVTIYPAWTGKASLHISDLILFFTSHLRAHFAFELWESAEFALLTFPPPPWNLMSYLTLSKITYQNLLQFLIFSSINCSVTLGAWTRIYDTGGPWVKSLGSGELGGGLVMSLWPTHDVPDFLFGQRR